MNLVDFVAIDIKVKTRSKTKLINLIWSNGFIELCKLTLQGPAHRAGFSACLNKKKNKKKKKIGILFDFYC